MIVLEIQKTHVCFCHFQGQILKTHHLFVKKNIMTILISKISKLHKNKENHSKGISSNLICPTHATRTLMVHNDGGGLDDIYTTYRTCRKEIPELNISSHGALNWGYSPQTQQKCSGVHVYLHAQTTVYYVPEESQLF